MTSMGVSGAEISGFVRDDSFDTADEATGPAGTLADSGGDADGADASGRRRRLKQEHSTLSDNFSVGGEDGEGYWERQCDPSSGMTYYLNEKVGWKETLEKN